MKTSKFLFALALGATIVACTPGEVEPAVDGQAVKEGVDEAVKTLKDYSPSKAEIDTVSYLLGVNFGSFLKGYNFGDVNYSKIIAGMKDFVAAKGDFRDPDFNKQFKISPDRINDAFNAYLEKRHNYILLENKDKGDKFLAANRKKAGVQENFMVAVHPQRTEIQARRSARTGEMTDHATPGRLATRSHTRADTPKSKAAGPASTNRRRTRSVPSTALEPTFSAATRLYRHNAAQAMKKATSP